MRGRDTKVGRLESSKLGLVVRYDIFDLAGDYVEGRSRSPHKWLKTKLIGGAFYRLLLNNRGELCVTTYFGPGGGFPANFVAQVENPDDIDHVLDMLAWWERLVFSGL